MHIALDPIYREISNVRRTENQNLNILVSSCSSPDRPISKKLGLKTILLISFRST